MTDSKTATERLRELLDNLGVKYGVEDKLLYSMTVWHGNTCMWAAIETPTVEEEGLALGVYKDFLTPEQAIAATLGNGECFNLRADSEYDEFECSECGHVDGPYCYAPEVGEHCKGCGREVVER